MPEFPYRYMCWLDLETTGLDPATDLLLEVGFILAEPKAPFTRFDSFTAVVRPDREFFVVDAVADMHKTNGLLDDVFAGGESLAHVEACAIGLLDRWALTGEFLLCGSGVSRFDRPWLNAHMPTLAGWFNPAGEIDVSTFRRMLNVADRPDLVATDTAVKKHRALPDAIDHHAEFCAYASMLTSVVAP